MSYQQTLQAISDDPQIWSQDDRAAVFQACIDSIADHGELHISHVRSRLTRDVAPHRIGANVNAFARRAHLVVVAHRPNGDLASGNRNKYSPVWAARENTP
ncbi:hypothetical protein [Timonella senegalensis]|uniref:hypothetical protein n=1 Tax=Timonella senegalensis TaxID=1465825 RepID=UPI0028AD0689|nr:hypothetical protein [Timonella senegalensis]